MLFYATSSENWGSADREKGKYPVKIYTIDGVLIYQDDIGGDNTGKTPLGGVLSPSSTAESMVDAIENPIVFYAGSWEVIAQAEHSKDLYNYYWSSYSRGTDGNWNNTQWHNVYLDGYIPLRAKSIYDPCPYLYRIPSNGTFNQFDSNPGWTNYSYLGGASWNIDAIESWFSGLGCNLGFNGWMGNGYWRMSTSSNISQSYKFVFRSNKVYEQNSIDARSYGFSVRCIDFATPPVARSGEVMMARQANILLRFILLMGC